MGLGLFTLVFYSLAALGAVTADHGEGNALTVGALVVGIAVQFFIPGIAAVIVLSRVNVLQWLGVAWKDWPKIFGIAPLCVLGMYLFSIGMYFLGYADLLEAMGVAKEQEAVTLFREGNDPVLLALMAFAAVVVAPICEEVVFRGYIYPVAKKFSGPRVAAVFSALVFAAAHGNVAALVPLFVFGLVLVAVYEKTGSIWAPVGVHFLFNASTVAIQLLARNVEIPQTVLR